MNEALFGRNLVRPSRCWSSSTSVVETLYSEDVKKITVNVIGTWPCENLLELNQVEKAGEIQRFTVAKEFVESEEISIN